MFFYSNVYKYLGKCCSAPITFIYLISQIQRLWSLKEMAKMHPAVKSICYTEWATPCNESSHQQDLSPKF